MNQIFAGHFEDAIVDEIALEGLEGITLEGLWTRLAENLKVQLPLRWEICVQVWQFIVKLPRHFQFFSLPDPRPSLQIVNRFKLLCSDALDTQIQECPSRYYKYNQIEDGEIRGSCEFYKERVEIGHEEIKDLTLEEINAKWGSRFIIVGVQHLREQALILDTHVPSLPSALKVQPYCFLERIGRSRHYGEATIGKHSLLNICSESVIIFYIRNRLSSLNLIKKQHYYEKCQTGSVLHLTRFSTIQQPIQVIVLADAIRYLQSRNGIAEHGKLKSYLSKHYELSIRKFAQTSLFKRYIFSDKALYRDVYPDATKEEYEKKSNRKEERVLKVLKLIDANIKVDDIYEEEDAEDEETVKSFLSKENLYLDLSMTEQIYETVKSHGSEGISQTALAKLLGCRKLCMRRFIKKVTTLGLIGFYLKDEGRQRLRMYVAKKFLQPNVQLAEQSTNAKSSSSVVESPQVPAILAPPIPVKEEAAISSLEFTDKDEPDFRMTVKEHHYETGNPRRTELLTVKQKHRRDTVLEITRKFHIVDTIQLIRAIIDAEQNLGYADTICRKTLSKILTPLVELKLLKIYDVRLVWREYVKNMKLVCDAPINLEHKIMSDELLKLKDSFFSTITIKKRKSIQDASASLLNLLKKKKGVQRNVKDLSERVGAAKYIRAKLIHEILFHLVYTLKHDQKPITFTEAAKAWKEFDLSIDASELQHKLPEVFNTEVNWTMFLSPLPEYEDYPEGWICVKDFLLRIPLSLFVKIHRVGDHANLLIQEYLKHPIRRFFTIRGLPLEVRDYIHFDKSYVRTIEEILRLLGYMGLVQFGPRLHRETIYNYIYVNRHAILVDTTTSDPGYAKISDDREYAQLQFYFETPSDITEFWLTIQNICMGTKLGYRCKKDKSEKPIRLIMKPLPEVRIEEASQKDVGYIVGNGRGAAGLDWKLFAHKMRNWDLSYNANTKSVDVTKLRPKTRYTTQKMPQRGVRQVFVKRFKKHIVVKRVKKIIYDDVDKECLQRMDQLRVRWNEKEDRLLMICRVANSFLQGNAGQKATIAFTCRDILQWHLRSMQKSSRACQRRILYLMRNKANVNQVNSWLNELYQNEYVNRTYGASFFVELRKLYRSVDMFGAVARIYFVQLVCFLVQLLDKTSIRQSDIIPDTLQQFSLLYRKSYDNNTAIRHFDPTTIDEVNESTINLLIHSSVCSQRDKMLYNIQLFEIYRSYDEGLIERCFRKVRFVDQLVVTGKMISKQKFPLLGKQVCVSSIYRQQFFVLIPYTIFEQCHQSLDALLESCYRPGEQSQIKYTCVNSGASILIMELVSIPGIRFDIQTPKQVLKFDPNQIQSSTHMPDKVIDHFYILNDKQTQAEYAKEIPHSSTTQAKKIKFNVNVSVHKIAYNTYDIISRLSEAHIHFFCALQHLNSTISIEDLQQKPYNCPFRCILQDANYLTTISNLIAENATLISNLFKTRSKTDTSADIEDAEFVGPTVNLNGNNILFAANYIRNIVKKLSIDDQKKDLGYIRLQQRQPDILQLANDALRMDNEADGYVSDEEELLMERGEGNPRYQDFLVVNTPTLSINFEATDDQLLPYKEMQVPERLLPSFNKKQQVLDKAITDALWKYVEYSVDDLEKEMNAERFSEREQELTKQLLEFIEKSEFGVTVSKLIAQFPDEDSLLKGLTILRKLSFIKRVGVGSFMYVHKMKVRPWIIHSFHVKRLEREAMAGQHGITLAGMKRKHGVEVDNPEMPKEKKPKHDTAPSTSRSKRSLKPTSRYSSEAITHRNSTPTEKINVNMRPAPWVRVNGTLNRRVFDKWIGTLLLECTIRCSIPVKNLFMRFHQLHPVNIMLLLECLEELECIQLKRCISKTVNLFSEEDQIEVSDGNELTNPENMFVIVKPDALLRLSVFIGDKKYQIDF